MNNNKKQNIINLINDECNNFINIRKNLKIITTDYIIDSIKNDVNQIYNLIDNISNLIKLIDIHDVYDQELSDTIKNRKLIIDNMKSYFNKTFKSFNLDTNQVSCNVDIYDYHYLNKVKLNFYIYYLKINNFSDLTFDIDVSKNINEDIISIDIRVDCIIASLKMNFNRFLMISKSDGIIYLEQM